MAYESNDKQEVVGTIGLTNFTELRISTVNSEEGFKAIDIRNWYSTQKDPDMKPTQKGVRIKKEDLAEVLNIILSNLDEETSGTLKEKFGYGRL